MAKTKYNSTAFNWEVSNQKDFQAAIGRLQMNTSNFRTPFNLIANDFYKGQRKLLTLKGAGLYQDLAPATGIEGNPTTTSKSKEAKQKRLGFTYPILLGKTGRLQGSLINKGHPEADFFLGKQTLIMGTKVNYARYHQSDEYRTVIPQRKVVFIDGGAADKAKDSSIAGRRERWLNIINSYILQLLDAPE